MAVKDKKSAPPKTGECGIACPNPSDDNLKINKGFQ
jgi:hypothetical protein